MSEPVMAAIIGSLITTEKQNWLVTQLTHVRHKLPLFMTSQTLPNKQTKWQRLLSCVFAAFRLLFFSTNQTTNRPPNCCRCLVVGVFVFFLFFFFACVVFLFCFFLFVCFFVCFFACVVFLFCFFFACFFYFIFIPFL